MKIDEEMKMSLKENGEDIKLELEEIEIFIFEDEEEIEEFL